MESHREKTFRRWITEKSQKEKLQWRCKGHHQRSGRVGVRRRSLQGCWVHSSRDTQIANPGGTKVPLPWQIITGSLIDCNGQVHGNSSSSWIFPYNLFQQKKEEEMNCKELRALTGLSQKKFGDLYRIPLRTNQNWEQGTNEAPEYVLLLLERAVREDFKTE